MLKVSFEPLTLLRVRGAGDRLAYAPGPGAVLSDDPLLPRLETIIGAIVSALDLEPELYSHEEMVEAVFGKGTKVYGPFLLKEDEKEKKDEVYVNIKVAYLKLNERCLNKYFKAYDFLKKNILFPKEFDEIKSLKSTLEGTSNDEENEKKRFKSMLDKENEDKCLLDPKALAFKSTHVALDYRRKSAHFGLLYSMSTLDLRGAKIIILVEPANEGEEIVKRLEDLKAINIPNTKSLARIDVKPIDINLNPHNEELRLVTSPIPLREVSEARPNPFYKGYEVANYIVGKTKKVRLGPEPLLPPGSFVKLKSESDVTFIRALGEESLKSIGEKLTR